MNDRMDFSQNILLQPTSQSRGCLDSKTSERAIHVSLIVLFLLVGSGLQGYANATIDAVFVALILLFIGVAVVRLVFPDKTPEMRVFLLSYVVCVFVGGLSQCYSLTVFGNPQSTIDAVYTFFPSISSKPPFTTIANIHPNFNSPLAVLIWQQVYKLTWWLNFEFGPYIGVMFNALVIGLTGSITVRTAREVFGHDAWRLRRVGTLFVFCGLFILFGSVLIRDCFTTFFNALVLWGIVRWLARPSKRNLLIALVFTAISVYAMAFLRFKSIVLFGMFWALALGMKLWLGRLNIIRMVSVLLIFCLLIIGSSYLKSYLVSSRKYQVGAMTGYNEFTVSSSMNDSLGMQMIVQKSLPIRLIFGSGSMAIYPIPLWAYFRSGVNDYHLIKGYHGIYQVIVMPLFIVGFLELFRMFYKDRKRVTPLLYLAMYLIMNLMAIVSTSMEQRHFAQFMTSFLILAALPDTREKKIEKKLRMITKRWLGVIFLVHLAWALLKAGM